MTFKLNSIFYEDNFIAKMIYFLIPLVILAILSISNFLIFHVLIELFSIIVGYMMFIIILYSQEKIQNNFLIFLGIAYGFIASFDLIHTLAYQGMGVFPTVGSDLATQLWIISRYLESTALVAAFWYIKPEKKFNYKKILFIFSAISLLLSFLVYFRLFPACHIEGSGLTPFKIISEYIISLILIISLFLLKKNREHFSKNIYNLMKYAVIFTIISEISFTLYIGVYDLSNIIGHFFKLFSFYYIFLAVIRTGIKEPYDILFYHLNRQKKELEKNQNYLSTVINSIPDIILLMDERGVYLDIWTSSPENLFASEEELLNRNIRDILPRKVADQFIESINKVIRYDEVQSIEYELKINNEKKFFAANFNKIKNEKNKNEILIIIRDITERKIQEKRLAEEKEKIEYISFHDQITGLYNRRYFENEIQRLNHSRKVPISIIIGDMDNLKIVNDNFGHKMGDKYLKLAGKVFSETTRKEDIVARIGGDEFAVILPETGAEAAADFCRRLKKTCKKYNKENELPLPLNISIGYATANNTGDDLNEIFVTADNYMYKNKGRSARK
ncbi:MAG: MASE3 domain-containing protein [Bacillota bacterium]